MGWASNYANIYEARVTALYEGEDQNYIDSIWGQIVPRISVGARVRVRGKYSRTFTLASNGIAEYVNSGVLTYEELDELEPGRTLALPTGMNNAAKSEVTHQPRVLLTQATAGRVQDGSIFRKTQRPLRFVLPWTSDECRLVIHDGSWISNYNMSGAWTNSISLDSISYGKLSLDQPHVVVIHIRQDGSSGGSVSVDDYEATAVRQLLICGQSPGKRPNCSAPLTYSERTSAPDKSRSPSARTSNFRPSISFWSRGHPGRGCAWASSSLRRRDRLALL